MDIGKAEMVYGHRDLIQAELPPYEPPPDWIPSEFRLGNPHYDNDLRRFLPRLVQLHRNRTTDALGFNIRGGQEHSCGIYISKVLPNTEAQRVGLQEADRILQVNNISLEDIDHTQAVHILKSNTDVEVLVQYFPYGYQKTYEKTRGMMAQQR